MHLLSITHLLVPLHRVTIVQYIECIEIRGFGQQGNLGRYEVLLYFRHIICKIYRSSLTASLYSFVLIGTLYFHMSGSVDGRLCLQLSGLQTPRTISLVTLQLVDYITVRLKALSWLRVKVLCVRFLTLIEFFSYILSCLRHLVRASDQLEARQQVLWRIKVLIRRYSPLLGHFVASCS